MPMLAIGVSHFRLTSLQPGTFPSLAQLFRHGDPSDTEDPVQTFSRLHVICSD